MRVSHPLHSYGRGQGTERICAFSDGVFAIAITLLVLNIQVPPAEITRPEALAHTVAALWPRFAAFGLSFAVIGVLWVTHHRMFAYIQAYDLRLIWLNLLVLLFVSFMPFAAGLLAEHGGAQFAVAFYARRRPSRCSRRPRYGSTPRTAIGS